MNEEKNQLPVKAEPQSVSIYDTGPRFEHFQRVAVALSKSNLVPVAFQNNAPNCLIALDMADRLQANPMAVMQSLYVVHGKPSWSASFLIAMINSCGRFDSLRFVITGEGDARQCVAVTKARSSSEVLESPPVSIGMAKAEGWVGRNGSKWKTMPELMLRYRAATFWSRLYAPELTLGMQTQEEVIDVEGADTPGGGWKTSNKPRLFEKPQAETTPADEQEATAGSPRGKPQCLVASSPADPPPRRKRRTKAEMEEARKAEAEPDTEPEDESEPEDDIPMSNPEEPTMTEPVDPASEFIQDTDGTWIRNPHYASKT